MAYQDALVKLTFNDGSGDKDLPYIQNISDPIEGMKANVIKGNRGDGSIIIPGGKKSIEIAVKGIIWSNEGYVDLITQMNELRTNITTNIATLTLKHWDNTVSGGGAYITDWAFTVRRIDEINFGSSMRTESIEYDIRWIVIAY